MALPPNLNSLSYLRFLIFLSFRWGKGRGRMFLTHLLNRLHRNFGKNLCFSWLDLRMHGLQSTRPQKVHFLFRGIRSHLEWWSRSLYAKTSLLCFWITGAGWSQEGQGNKNPLATLCTNRHQRTADNLTPYPKQYECTGAISLTARWLSLSGTRTLGTGIVGPDLAKFIPLQAWPHPSSREDVEKFIGSFCYIWQFLNHRSFEVGKPWMRS